MQFRHQARNRLEQISLLVHKYLYDSMYFNNLGFFYIIDYNHHPNDLFIIEFQTMPTINFVA